MDNTETMEKKILAHLKDIEKEHRIRVLLAVEIGSRAWGFESQDDNWNIHFIYVHKLAWYLHIEQQTDEIICKYDDIEFTGMELKTTLSSYSKGDGTLLKCLFSPKIFYLDEEFSKRISIIGNDDIAGINRLLYDMVRKQKRFMLRMHPGFRGELFWNKDWIVTGSSDRIFLNDNICIHPLNIEGLKEWQEENFDNSLNWTERQWKEWWERGRVLAYAVKDILPDYVDLYYMSFNSDAEKKAKGGGRFDTINPILIE